MQSKVARRGGAFRDSQLGGDGGRSFDYWLKPKMYLDERHGPMRFTLVVDVVRQG